MANSPSYSTAARRPVGARKFTGSVAPVPKMANPYLATTTSHPAILPRPVATAARAMQGIAPGTVAQTDPILSRIQALSQQSLSKARAERDNLRQQSVIDFGDEGIARDIGLDENTITAAKSNPFSRRANLLNESNKAEQGLENDLNSSNLFYSGYRTNELTDFARRRAEAETSLGNDLRSQLALVDQNYAAAEYAAQLQEAEAARQAILDALINGTYDDPPESIIDPADSALIALPQTVAPEDEAAAEAELRARILARAGYGPEPTSLATTLAQMSTLRGLLR